MFSIFITYTDVYYTLLIFDNSLFFTKQSQSTSASGELQVWYSPEIERSIKQMRSGYFTKSNIGRQIIRWEDAGREIIRWEDGGRQIIK